MNETKADMYGSYLAVFSFAIAMVVLPLVFDSKVGSVLWALVAWQIYRRDKSTLIVTLRLLFWFIVLGAIVSIVWLLLGPPNVNLRQFVEAEGIGLAISAGVLWWMHSFFEKSPTAADIFSPVVAEEPASADIATVESPAPRPNANIVVSQAPASPGIATVESPAPKPPAQNIVTSVFGRAKRVMSWRRRPPQPASAGNPPADHASAPANKGGRPDAAAQPTKAAQYAALVATKTADTAAPLPAVPKQNAALVAAKTADTAAPLPPVPKQVADSPAPGAEPSVSAKTVPPQSDSTIPLPTMIDDERIYAEIARELETGGIDKGLWTRLFAECDGDKKRTKVIYIRQRAERLIAAERARRLK